MNDVGIRGGEGLRIDTRIAIGKGSLLVISKGNRMEDRMGGGGQAIDITAMALFGFNE